MSPARDGAADGVGRSARAPRPVRRRSRDRDVLFMPRTHFHLAAEHLSSDDPRFVWDANFGGELDRRRLRHRTV